MNVDTLLNHSDPFSCLCQGHAPFKAYIANLDSFDRETIGMGYIPLHLLKHRRNPHVNETLPKRNTTCRDHVPLA